MITKYKKMNKIENKYVNILWIISGIILVLCLYWTGWAAYKSRIEIVPLMYMWRLVATLFLQIILSIVAKSIIIMPGITYRYPNLPIRYKENKKKYLYTLWIFIMIFIAIILSFIDSTIPNPTEGIPRSFIQHNEYEMNFEIDPSILTWLIFE